MVRRNFAFWPRIILVRCWRKCHPNDPPAGGQDLPLALTQIPDQVRNDGFRVCCSDSSYRHPDDPPAGGQDLPLSDDKTDSELNSE